MKPIQLVLSAFGSFAEETRIDFTKVQHGIFLIAGDTGSGKTTIFDAIVYALYDRTSGGAREGSDMRSQYASPETPTFVEYTFSYGKEIYTIKRNPKYTRISKRKDKAGNYKETTEQPQVELKMPDGVMFQGKIKECNEKIVDIIGLDAEQFTQIAMIAQGEFMKLLQATSNKRKEIFGRIFQTQIYVRLQEELRRRAKTAQDTLEENRRRCEQELQGVKGSREPLLFTEGAQDALLDELQELICQELQKEQELEQKRRNNQKELDQRKAFYTAGEEVNRLFAGMEQAKARKDQLEKEEEQQEERKKLLYSAKRASEAELEEERREAAVKRAEQLERQLKQYIVTQKQDESRHELLTQKKETAAQRRKEKEPELQEKIIRLQDTMPAYEQAREQQAELEKKKKEVDKLAGKERKERKEVESQQKDLVEHHRQAVEALTQFQKLNDLFIAEQAGIMAASLQEGQPCPVCGSVNHPKKAQILTEAVTQEMVNAQKEIWREADEKEGTINQKLGSLRETLEATSRHVLEESEALKVLEAQYHMTCQRLTFSDRDEAEKQLGQLQSRIQKLKEEEQEIQKQWQQCQTKLMELSGKIQEQQSQHTLARKEVLQAEEAFQKKLLEKAFENEAEYQKAKQTKQQIAKWEQQIQEYRDNILRNEEALHHFEQQLQGKSKVDIIALKQQLLESEGRRKELEQEYQDSYHNRQRNQEIMDRLKEMLEKRKQQKKVFELYSHLDKTANGGLAGTAKIDFQTYIQRQYFEKMIRAANKRLVRMTGNQFVLQCRRLDKLGSQGAVGLDLDVYSLMNDKTRDVKTLSGGESFMAALAMALGMADIIQSTAGKVQIDTMFVDEGFGSLDDEARAESMKVLQELAGDRRLVGIISHVSELKEQIDRKLQVQKDEEGSHVAWNL